MKVLVTGGFGGVGVCLIDELAQRGHEVTVFDLPGKRTRQAARAAARKHGHLLRGVVFGDIRHVDEVAAAVSGQDAVIHMAAILPPASEKNPELCSAINLGGTHVVLSALSTIAPQASLVLVSSVAAGAIADPDTPAPGTEAYALSKARAERAVRETWDDFSILRLSAVLPSHGAFKLGMARLIYDIPLEARCEIVLDTDAASALASAAEDLREAGKARGNTYVIAGGNDCRLLGKDIANGMLGAVGLPLPAAELFSDDVSNFSLRWYDTAESQGLFHYQNHTFDDFRHYLSHRYRLVLPVTRVFGRAITARLERLSPRYDHVA